MQSGESETSYAKNSYGPAAALAMSKPMLINSVKLINGGFSSHLKIADLGCAIGDNTLSTVDTVVEVLRGKLDVNDGGAEPEMELEVFFSDLPSNDFNTLFRSLDKKLNGKYFAAGVPGSFYTRLFPKGELHVVVTMSALQWLSQLPEKGSKTWNKGRVGIEGAEKEVIEAYAEQADKDLIEFLMCRKEEIVIGGVLFMLMGGRPSGSMSQFSDPDSSLKHPLATLMDQAWQDLVDEGLIEEEKRDGFNIPVYNRSTEEIVAAIDRCGGFKIERMENFKVADHMNGKQEEFLKDPVSYGRARANIAQASIKPMVEAHLGPDLTRKLFKRMRGRGPRGGFASSCGGDGSTSTLNQHQKIDVGPSVTPENTPFGGGSPRTLEEMILQLEVEEDIVRRARLRESYYGTYDNCDDDDDTLYYQPARMSCVNSSDILRSARNALNQYPRFSLDGKDAMYRSSFRCQLGAAAGVARQGGQRAHRGEEQRARRSNRVSLETTRLPRTVAGESVVWCETGVVAKLMGLEMIPVPVKGKTGKDKLGTLLKRERLRRRDRTLDNNGPNGQMTEASCSTGGFNAMRPTRAVGSPSRVGGWPTLRIP
ncbi:hypothetical protein AALP_AA7G096900 [Arabis alpina]|uniref:Uncharacterized protein n=1 Tax=Arabis alpina TaxID=50452 RepID=A0A087GH08_ARAAL|nr:hypothetical protein AALP_AA7G096900 [Arabis alpina]